MGLQSRYRMTGLSYEDRIDRSEKLKAEKRKKDRERQAKLLTVLLGKMT